ncbi:hypothetical protein PHAVU_002G124200 [Phaseolus vulgaris]|uniref:non-specific serine/threonine protein kinase n=1 Tax=Phaseolus vulgaris TaxID=3885 RepID=V7CMG3_PHAVU|nr:hypothetical protein PHAVU_002G124200g [Phaseolus vulgaris]ESW30096.1 hypothetical protein PHAVU_002G124200g [Phaseolus vulgaris]
MLQYLYLQGNSLQGFIPPSLASLKEYLNVSFNMLDGEVPTEGVFRNASGLVVTGNGKLCGGIPEVHLPPCTVKGVKLAKHLKFKLLAVLFRTLELDDRVVAIMVLNLQRKGAQKSFIAECNALKNVKHRNLVPILTCCSSTDYKGEEFKALVFEYMRNGSLEQWLHRRTLGAEHQRSLNLDERLNIMIDVASAIHYLHHECEKLIIHCDLKPTNVLLDDDMVARVSDFGIARLLSTVNSTTSGQTSTICIKGTVGYAPPVWNGSMNGDMYSFGILLLEILTGRKPTDEIFGDGQNLYSFVKNSFPDNLLQILDPSLVPNHGQASIDEENNQNLTSSVQKCLVLLVQIGLKCSVEAPDERMNIVVDVNIELSKIRRTFLIERRREQASFRSSGVDA